MDAARGLVIPLSVEATSGNGTSARNVGLGCLFFWLSPQQEALEPTRLWCGSAFSLVFARPSQRKNMQLQVCSMFGGATI